MVHFWSMVNKSYVTKLLLVSERTFMCCVHITEYVYVMVKVNTMLNYLKDIYFNLLGKLVLDSADKSLFVQEKSSELFFSNNLLHIYTVPHNHTWELTALATTY